MGEKQVKPFSNASEAICWQAHNCLKCELYENESKTEQEAGCIPAFYIDLGFITGEMPEKYAEQIGIMSGMECKIKSSLTK